MAVEVAVVVAVVEVEERAVERVVERVEDLEQFEHNLRQGHLLFQYI